MNDNLLTVIIEDDRWLNCPIDAESLLQHIFLETLNYLAENNLRDKSGISGSVEVNLALSNDEEVHRLNAEFRGMDKPTNVLSFANIDGDIDTDADRVELGDIIIALETLTKEAEEKGILLQNHLAHLFVHGLLHLFGYDHQEDEEADEMEGIEIKILQRFDIKNPYEEQ